MALETKTFTTLVSPDDESGLLTAMFSTFHTIDKDGDVVLPTAFTAGQEVPMVWHHDWQRPVGKGVIEVTPEGAVFKGKFNLNTTWGRDAYESVKFAGPLQEYSWGFRVTDFEHEDRGDAKVRVIKGARVFEVSPVLVGAGENTRTLGIKADYTNLSLEDHTGAALAAVDGWLGRMKALDDLRAKEGRRLNAGNRDRLRQALESIDMMRAMIESMLQEAEPPEKEKVATIDARQLYAEFLRTQARLQGVPV